MYIRAALFALATLILVGTGTALATGNHKAEPKSCEA